MKQIAIFVSAAILFTLVSIPSLSNASSEIVYASTPAFDSGNKSDPGQDYFVANGVDQTTYSFINKPSAIYSDTVQKTFIVYQGGSGYTPYIVTYDHVFKRWSNPVQVNDTNPVSGDGHGAPALWIDGTGFIYVFYGAHATRMQLKRSVAPYDISSWVQLPSPTPGGVPSNQGTYPHLFGYNGYLYFFYRQGTSAGGIWGYRKSNDGGQTWTTFHTILSFSPDGAYVSDLVLGSDATQMYYTFVWDNRTVPGFPVRHNAYVCRWDLSTDIQYGIDGSNLGSVLSLANANNHCRAIFSGASEIWISKMKLDGTNHPWVLFINGTVNSSAWNIQYTRWTNIGWIANQPPITTSDGSSSYMDLNVAPDGLTAEAFLITGGFKQFNGDDFSGTLERWTYNEVWSKQETILTEEKAGNPVNRPYIPLNARSDLRLIFDEWSPKDTNVPEQRMWAWGDRGFVYRREIPSGTQGTETYTDNIHIANGTFQLNNGLSDTFATNHSNPAFTYQWSNIRTGDGSGIISRRFINGKYNVSFTNPGGTGRLGATLRSNFGVQGSLIDIRFQYQITIPHAGNTPIMSLCMFNQPDECDTVSGDYFAATYGVMYLYFPTFSIFRVLKVFPNGFVQQIGVDHAASPSLFFMRLVRNGTTFSFYRSTNGISWTLDETQTIANMTATTWFPHMSIYTNGVIDGLPWSVEGDNFNVASGTLDSAGYRPSGSWVTPINVFSSDVVKRIYVNYSDASINRYIDSISVISSTGEILFTDPTKHTAGVGAIATVPDDILAQLDGKDWKVQVSMKGDGLGSVIVSSVVVQSVRSPIAVLKDDVSNASVLLAFVGLMVLFIVLMFWVRRKRGMIEK